MLKQKHIHWPTRETEELKIYHLRNFNPQQFRFEPKSGHVSVVLKETLYDDKKNIMMVHVVVSEEELVQHFWMKFVKKSDGWLLRQADGQSFFRTDGIKEALDLVYEAALKTID